MHAEYETINHHKQTPIKTSCSSFSRFHSQCCLCVSSSSLLTLFKSVNRTSSQYHFSFTFKYQHIFIRPPSFCLRTLFCQSTSVCWYANGSTVKGIAKIRASIKCWKLLYSVCALNSGFYYCFNGVRGWLFACYNLFDLNTFQFQYHFMGSMISLKTDWTIGGGQLLSVRLLCNGNICADKFSSHLRKNNMVTSSNLYQGRSSHIYTMECLGKGTVFNHVIATFLFRIKLLTKLTSDLLSQSGCFASGSHSMESNLIAKNTIWEVYSAPPFCLTTSWKYKTRATEWRAKIVFQLG